MDKIKKPRKSKIKAKNMIKKQLDIEENENSNIHKNYNSRCYYDVEKYKFLKLKFKKYKQWLKIKNKKNV